MRRLLGMTVMLLVTASIFPSSAFAVPDQANPSTVRVFADMSAYEQAIDISMTKMTTETAMSDEQKLQRAQEVSKALSGIDVTDVASQQKVAEEYGLFIYNPNLQPSDVSTLDSVESDVTFYRPTVIYDSSIQWEYYHGEWTWESIVPVDQESHGGEVGGVDNTGLNFSNVPDYTRVAGYYVQTYDQAGNTHDFLDTRSYRPETDGKYAALFNGYDYLYTVPVPRYTWYSADVWVYFNYRLSAYANGYVETVYAHTWDTTRVTGASFTAEGNSENKASFGLTFEFSTEENKWVAASLATGY